MDISKCIDNILANIEKIKVFNNDNYKEIIS